ncbi:MAG: methionine synthase [Methanomicrobiales archaeon HGW-Methanomicrobiales-4]|nr:MAG: methionine synthase [Methanomicrobiales archaeon HGW-Methanomicrobiales-4]
MVNPFIPGQILPTTVVGSFPAEPRRTFRSLLDPYHEAVCQAVDAQVAAGITIISDGQVRGDMIGTFASHLPGVRGKDVIGRVMPPDTPITIKDTRYARTRHPYVKGIITGPSTLSYGLHMNTSNYRSRDEVIPDIADALSVEACALSDCGITMLQIDEPIFSTGIADLALGREAILRITKKVKVPVCLHVCGSLSKIIEDLVRMPVQVLDFEGSVDPENFASLSARDLGDKYIGFGCVDSSKARVEDLNTVISRLRRGVDVLGHTRLLPDPDCGLRMLDPGVASAKLSRLCEAVAVVRSEVAE